MYIGEKSEKKEGGYEPTSPYRVLLTCRVPHTPIDVGVGQESANSTQIFLQHSFYSNVRLDFGVFLFSVACAVPAASALQAAWTCPICLSQRHTHPLRAQLGSTTQGGQTSKTLHG